MIVSTCVYYLDIVLMKYLSLELQDIIPISQERLEIAGIKVSLALLSIYYCFLPQEDASSYGGEIEVMLF